MTLQLLLRTILVLAALLVAWYFFAKPISQLFQLVRRLRPKPTYTPRTAKERYADSQKELEDAKLNLEAALMDEKIARLQKEHDKIVDAALKERDSL